MVFLMLACWGILILVQAVARLPETLPAATCSGDAAFEATSIDANPSGKLERTVATVFQQHQELVAYFMTLLMLGPLMLAIVSNTPFILDAGYGMNTTGIFLVISMYAVVSLLGSLTCMFLLERLTVYAAVQRSMLALLVLGPMFIVVGVLPRPRVEVFLVFPALFIFLQAILQGPLRSLFMQPFDDNAGTAMGLASALNGPLAAATGFGLTLVLEAGATQAWMQVLGVIMLLQQLCWWPFTGYDAVGLRCPQHGPQPLRTG